MADSLRTKLAMLGVGTLLGVGMGVAAAKTVSYLRGGTELPEGAAFESVDDLRRSMLARDDRDVRPDQSVNLRAIITPDPSDLIIFKLKPDLDVKFEDVNVKTNRFGLRGPETTVEKPADTYRVALLGDSFAFGWGVEQDKIFASVIERELTSGLGSGKRAEVLNFGVPGYSTFQEVALLEQEGLKFNPDAVLVYFIENDFGLPFFIKNFAEGGNLVNNRHFHTLKKDSQDTEAEAGHNKLLSSLNSNYALERLTELCIERGMQLFVIINPGKNWDKTEKRLWAVRRLPGLNFIPVRDDVNAIVEKRGLSQRELSLPRDPHPSAVRHEILGQVMAQKLLPFAAERMSIREAR